MEDWSLNQKKKKKSFFLLLLGGVPFILVNSKAEGFVPNILDTLEIESSYLELLVMKILLLDTMQWHFHPIVIVYIVIVTIVYIVLHIKIICKFPIRPGIKKNVKWLERKQLEILHLKTQYIFRFWWILFTWYWIIIRSYWVPPKSQIFKIREAMND